MRYNYYGKSLACLAVMLGCATSGFAQVDVGTYSANTKAATYATLREAVENAESGKTVYLYLSQDLEETGSITLADKKITLNLQGHKLTLTKGTGETVANLNVEGSNASFQVKGGSKTSWSLDVNNDYKVTYNDQGTLELDGTIYAKGGGYVYVASGNVVSTKRSALYAQGDLTGTTDVNSRISVYDGYIKAQECAAVAMGKGASLTIGSKFSSDSGPVLEALDNAVVAGNGVKGNGGTSIQILNATLIGRIQSSGYIACGIYHPQEGTLSVGYKAKIYALGGCGILMRGGKLTMGSAASIVATGDKTLTGKVGDSSVLVGTSGIVYDYDSGYYDGKNVTVNITGTSTEIPSITSSSDAISVINSDNADVSNVFDIQKGTYSSDVTKFVDTASGYTCDKEGDVYGVHKYIAQAGTTKYEYLDKAINGAKDNETITILQDYSSQSAMTFKNRNLTLDLNGKHVKCHSVVVNGGHLIIKDAAANTNLLSTYAAASSVTEGVTGGLLEGWCNSNYTVDIKNGGVVTLESGTVVNTYSTKGPNVVFRVEGDSNMASDVKSTVNINGGTVKTIGTPVFVVYKGATVNVNGGELEGSGLAAIAGNGTDAGTTINVTGGTLTAHAPSDGSASCGIYNPQDGVVNISGGKITSEKGPGVLMRSGKLNMTGGEVVALGDKDFTGTVGDANLMVAASGIVFDRDANYPAADNTEVKIQGNDVKISGAKSAVELLNTNNVEEAKEAVRVVSGTFSSDVSEFTEENYTAVPNADGTYSIETGDVVLVSDNSYINNVTEGSTLEFSADKINKFLVNNNVANVTVKMTKSFSTTNWAAFYVPFEISLTEDLLNHVEFAELWDTELDKNTNGTTLEFIKLSAGDKISAHTPCIIKAKTPGEQTLEFPNVTITKSDKTSIECSTIKQKFTFYGTLENTTLLDKHGYYIDPATQQLSAVDNGTAFVRSCKFYMTIQNKSDNSYVYPTSDIQQAKAFSFSVIGDDEITGIAEINKATTTKAGVKIYNMQGVYVGNDIHSLRRGVYVVNGSKVVIK